MSCLLNENKAVPRPSRLLVAIALLLFTPLAVAQNTLGELLDASAKKISPEEFRQQVVQRTIVGAAPSGARMELIYAASGVIGGRAELSQAVITATGANVIAPIDGVWTIDDSGRICTSITIQSLFLPFRCQYWFKYKDDYFVADSDSDRGAKVLRRTVKQ